MKIQISQTSALHEKGSRFKNEDFVYPILDGAEIDESVADAIPNIPGLYMVCDGVGGEKKGEIASQLVVAQFAKYFEAFPPKGKVTYGYLSAALIRVEEAISNYIKEYPDSRGMATTLSLAYIDDHGAILAWIGDSRIYHYRGEKLMFKSRDHSQVNEMVDKGEISEEDAESHPQRNVVLRSIQGTENPTDMDTHFVPIEELESSDYFFLCSDGILEEVDDAELKTMFGSDFGLEDIRQEIFSLCKGSSRDNFSCYIVQLGEVDKTGLAASIPVAEVIEEEEQVILDDVAEPPAEEIQDGASILASLGLTDKPTEAGETIMDRLGHGEAGDTETPKTEGESLFDRLNKDKDSKPSSEDLGYEKIKASHTATPPVDEQPEIKDEPILTRKEPSFWSTPAILGTVLLLALVFGIWYFWPNESQRLEEKFAAHKEQTINSMKSENWNRSLLFADSAFAVAKTLDDVNKKTEIEKLYKGIAKEKSEDLADMFAEARYYREKNTYPGYWQARNLYSQALNDHAFMTSHPDRASLFKNLIDTAQVNKDLRESVAAMNKIPEKDAFKQFLTEAMSLCELKKGDEADTYFAAASDLAKKLNKEQDLLQAQKVCTEAVQMADGSTPPDRSVDPAKTTTKTIPTSPKSTTPAKTTPAKTTPAKSTTTKAKPGPIAGKDNTTSSKANTTSSGIAAKPATPTVPTAEQIRYLEKAKTLFTKSRTTMSRYEEKKAVEYFQKSGNALDGEGNYMLSVLYNTGFGVDQSDKKALAYAKKSAKDGYMGGHYYYASLLLETGNSKDSLTAKSSLNIAASKGYQEATNKLFELQTEMAARRRQ